MPEGRRNEFVDLYELLEISPRASQDVIQAAYRVLARNNHPDLNGTAVAELRIRELNAAYRVLSDPEGRARYDLECSRVRRNGRATQVTNNERRVISTPSETTHSRARVWSLSPAITSPRADDRLPVLNGPALLGILLMVAMLALLLVILWLAFDTATDYNPAYGAPTVEWAGR